MIEQMLAYNREFVKNEEYKKFSKDTRNRRI